MKKNIVNIIPIALIILMILSSCDEITPPYTEKQPFNPDTGANPITPSTRKILFEEYTGHICEHCPVGHDSTKSLKKMLGERFIPVAIHAGAFTATGGTMYTYDFTTPEGNELHQRFFGSVSPGKPFALISRTQSSSKYNFSVSQWQSQVMKLVSDTARLSIKLNITYDSTSKNINIKSELEYFKAGTPDDYFCLFITQDSIIKYQMDKRQTPKNIPDYRHEHVLRGTVNGAWGETLSNSNIPKGTKFSKEYNFKIVKADWDPKYLKIIAFVYDYNKTYEVWQAEEKDVIPH